MTPIDIDELFELNPDYKFVSWDGEVLIVDNWYKNFDKIQKVMEQQTPVRFETDSNDGINENNFKDYYDCRVVFTSTSNNTKYYNTIQEIEKIINENIMPIKLSTQQGVLFNYFKYAEAPENNIQAIPHTDGGHALAGVIYIDNICSGGTALYDYKPENTTGSGVVDISNFNKKYNYKLKRVIEAKPNRLVLYKGDQWHGAYIEDNKKYVNKWRINQVHFFGVENG